MWLQFAPVDYLVHQIMKETEDDMNIIEHLSEGTGLRLVPVEKRESLLPDPELKAIIEKMKGRQERKRVRLTLGDEPDAA